ncbi:MAG: hypothetical protein JWM59_1008 [Verrucomicrobiales bacterium]|nr:hypothetical protein [Verrucomicrobiales bacterium]
MIRFFRLRLLSFPVTGGKRIRKDSWQPDAGRRLPLVATAAGDGRIGARSGGERGSTGHRLNPEAPSRGAGVTGDLHVTGDMKFFFRNSVGGVTPMPPEGWRGGHRGGDTGVTRGVASMAPDRSIMPSPSGRLPDGSLSGKPEREKAGIRAEPGSASVEALAAPPSCLRRMSAGVSVRLRRFIAAWRRCSAHCTLISPAATCSVAKSTNPRAGTGHPPSPPKFSMVNLSLRLPTTGLYRSPCMPAQWLHPWRGDRRPKSHAGPGPVFFSD